MLAELPPTPSFPSGTSPLYQIPSNSFGFATTHAAPEGAGLTQVPSSAITPGPSAPTHAPVAMPHLPAPPPRGRPKASGPPWLLLGVLGGGVATIALALFVVLALARRADEPATSPRSPVAGSPRNESGGHMALRQITTDMLIERVEAAGFKVVNNQEIKNTGYTISTVSVMRDNRGGYALLYHWDNLEIAKSTEKSMSEQDDNAVLREDHHVLVVKVANGAERGNAASRRLLAAIVR
jgi:hypothetical protein